jgi:hypothetical protein
MNTAIDQLLELQIKIARAGESERLCWWRIDATDQLGGGDFFQRLVGQELSGLAAIEAALAGAKIKEKNLLEEAGLSTQTAITLFHLPLETQNQLNERMRFFKSHPEQIPEDLRALFRHETEFKAQDLERELNTYPKPSYERSAFGRKIRGGLPEDVIQQARQLASLLLPLEKQHYPLPYYPASS